MKTIVSAAVGATLMVGVAFSLRGITPKASHTDSIDMSTIDIDFSRCSYLATFPIYVASDGTPINNLRYAECLNSQMNGWEDGE